MGIGDWGLGIGDWAHPQSPIPNPQSPNPLYYNNNKTKINLTTIILFCTKNEYNSNIK